MRDVLKYIKRKNEDRPENIIKGIDPVAISLLKQIYSALKDRGENLVLYERSWVTEIEKIYKDKNTFDLYFISGLETLLKQAYNILTSKSKTWDIKQEELLAIIEKVLFVKSREHLYKDFYDEVEAALFSAIQLDFSKRIGLTKIGNSKENIFSYNAVILNTMIEAMENSVVSMQSVNEIIKNLPTVILIITDQNGNIRFINDFGESTLGVETAGKHSIFKILPGIEELEKEFYEKGQLKNKPFSFTEGKQKLRIFSTVDITISKTSSVLDELIYIINVRPTKKKDKGFGLKQVAKKAAPLNSLSIGLDALSKKLIDKESKIILDGMRKSIEELKTITNIELGAMADNSIKGGKKKKRKRS